MLDVMFIDTGPCTSTVLSVTTSLLGVTEQASLIGYLDDPSNVALVSSLSGVTAGAAVGAGLSVLAARYCSAKRYRFLTLLFFTCACHDVDFRGISCASMINEVLFKTFRRFHVRVNFLEDVSIYFKRIHYISRSLFILSLFMDIQNSTFGYPHFELLWIPNNQTNIGFPKIETRINLITAILKIRCLMIIVET